MMSDGRSFGFSQAVVLLCGGVIDDENAWRSSARVTKAVELIEKNDESCLLITSGISGHIGFKGEPESHCYLAYLQDKFPSVCSSRVFIEDLSRDTVGNVYFSLKILKLLIAGSSRVTWVTNGFHADRLNTIVRCLDQSGFFNHELGLVKDLDSGRMMTLLDEETESKQRFLADLSMSCSNEALLFLHHNFYRIDRFTGDN